MTGEDANATPPRPGDGQRALERRSWTVHRQWQTVAWVTLVIVVLVAGSWLADRFLGSKPPAAAAVQSPPGTFRATSAQLKTLTVDAVRVHAFVSEVLAEGKIAVDADRTTPVLTPYSGRVGRVLAGLGDRVKPGAPLATVEASEFVQAQNDLQVALAQLKLARSNESRKHALYETKGGSQQDWQQAQADLSAAEAALNAVRERLRIFGLSQGAIARLERLQHIDPVATINAPIAGIVVDRQVGPGQYLQAGGGPIFTIADVSTVWLLANVREADAGMIKVGQFVEVSVLAYPHRTFKARIDYVGAQIDPSTHRLPVRATMDNRDAVLKPEMFADFRFFTSAANEAPAVPEAAIVYEGDAAHVWVVSGDGLIAYRAIHTGRDDAGLVEIIEGLKPGEQIVTRGGLFIDQAAAPATS
jgi:cobalt-zinc-cadmium efflux system membrane fusion protein